MEDWVTIKNLKKHNPKLGTRQIARLLGVSRNTVKKALQRREVPEYKRQKKISALEPFRDVISEMTNVKHFKGSRILNEVRSKGYKGSQTAFYDFLSKVKISEQKHFTPYETAPGEQAQFDWSPYTVLIGGELTKIYLCSYINSFSRYQIFEVSLSQNQAAVYEALENSIIESGGACLRVQTDNAKAFVINASKNNFQWNSRYLTLCAHYGFTPTRSIPKHPWSKGKVEKPFSFVETHFIAGSSFEDFLELQNKLKDFQRDVNNRVHSTIKTKPVELFNQEKLSLLDLPEYRYVGVKEDTRKVSYDCLISYNGSRYSVPWMFAGKFVWIKISKGYYLQIYSQSNKLIAEHKLSIKKGSTIIIQEHYKSYKDITESFETLKEKFLESFPEYSMFLEKLLAQKRQNAHRQLKQILYLSKLYSNVDFSEALNKSMEYNVFNHSFISGYLEKNHKQSFRIEPVKTKTELPKGDVKRELSQYKIFI
ncbi:MAG: IS21 family transposase [Ignavibacteriaceae bacterium]